MIANKLTILTATAALLEPALGLGHRHAHQQHAQKRGEWITATINGQVVSWENNYYGPNGAPPAATQPAAASQPEAPAAPAPAPAQPTTIIKVAKPSQAAKPAYKPAQPKKEEAAAAPQKAAAKPAIKEKTQSKAVKSGGSAGLSHKRGLAYNDANRANNYATDCKNCGWGYNWEATPKGFDGLTYIPTLKSNETIFTSTFDDYCAKALDNGAPAIFSFNEPDIAAQADLTPAEAVQLHQQYLNPYSGKALIGAPSISNSGLPNQGLEWLKSWISECNGDCKFDFCNVHWYSELQYASTLFDHLKAAHDACEGKPLWLTEFGPADGSNPSPDALSSWLKETIPKLEDLDYLDAYSYFWVDQGLMPNDQISSYGKVYASA